jgi:hypothetical protein
MTTVSIMVFAPSNCHDALSRAAIMSRSNIGSDEKACEPRNKQEKVIIAVRSNDTLEQTARSEIDRSKDAVRKRTEPMSDILRRKQLRRTALLGSVLLMLVCMALFGAARFFVV